MSILSIGEILIDFTPVEGMKHSYTAKYGSISGGLCVQKHGGIPALPSSEEIDKFLL